MCVRAQVCATKLLQANAAIVESSVRTRSANIQEGFLLSERKHWQREHRSVTLRRVRACGYMSACIVFACACVRARKCVWLDGPAC